MSLKEALQNCGEIMSGYSVMFEEEESKEYLDLKKKLGLDVVGLQTKLKTTMVETWRELDKESKGQTQIDQFVRRTIGLIAQVKKFLDYSPTQALAIIPELRTDIVKFQQYEKASLGNDEDLIAKMTAFKEKEKGVYEKLIQELDTYLAENKKGVSPGR